MGKTIAEDKIYERLGKHSGAGWDQRSLVRIKADYGPNKSGTVTFYFLTGSPPKGYAIYVPSLRQLSFYDARGKRFRITDEVVEIEESSDTRFFQVGAGGDGT